MRSIDEIFKDYQDYNKSASAQMTAVQSLLTGYDVITGNQNVADLTAQQISMMPSRRVSLAHYDVTTPMRRSLHASFNKMLKQSKELNRPEVAISALANLMEGEQKIEEFGSKVFADTVNKERAMNYEGQLRTDAINQQTKQYNASAKDNMLLKRTDLKVKNQMRTAQDIARTFDIGVKSKANELETEFGAKALEMEGNAMKTPSYGDGQGNSSSGGSSLGSDNNKGFGLPELPSLGSYTLPITPFNSEDTEAQDQGISFYNNFVPSFFTSNREIPSLNNTRGFNINGPGLQKTFTPKFI